MCGLAFTKNILMNAIGAMLIYKF